MKLSCDNAPAWVKQINSLCSLSFLLISITCPLSIHEIKPYTQSFQITQKMSWEHRRQHPDLSFVIFPNYLLDSVDFFPREFAATQAQIYCIIPKLLHQQGFLYGKAWGEGYKWSYCREEARKTITFYQKDQLWSSTFILLPTPATYLQKTCCKPRDNKEGQIGEYLPILSTCEISILGSCCYSFANTSSSQCSCKRLWTITWRTVRLLKDCASNWLL